MKLLQVFFRLLYFDVRHCGTSELQFLNFIFLLTVFYDCFVHKFQNLLEKLNDEMVQGNFQLVMVILKWKMVHFCWCSTYKIWQIRLYSFYLLYLSNITSPYGYLYTLVTKGDDQKLPYNLTSIVNTLPINTCCISKRRKPSSERYILSYRSNHYYVPKNTLPFEMHSHRYIIPIITNTYLHSEKNLVLVSQQARSQSPHTFDYRVSPFDIN